MGTPLVLNCSYTSNHSVKNPKVCLSSSTWSNNKRIYIVWPHLQNIYKKIVILTKSFDSAFRIFNSIKHCSDKMQQIYDTFMDIRYPFIIA